MVPSSEAVCRTNMQCIQLVQNTGKRYGKGMCLENFYKTYELSFYPSRCDVKEDSSSTQQLSSPSQIRLQHSQTTMADKFSFPGFIMTTYELTLKKYMAMWATM